MQDKCLAHSKVPSTSQAALRMKAVYVCTILAALLASAAAQPVLPGQGFLPGGNLLSVDNGGPYNLTYLSVQANEIKAGIAAKQDYTDKDIVNFLTNVECLEGLFDTWGTFGYGFLGNLTLGGPTPIGARKANLTAATIPYLEEVALNEQGHALFTRHAGGSLPCPLVDFDTGFNELLAFAYGLPANQTIAQRFGAPFDPFLNDVNFVLSVLTLEELGATGNKGLIALTTNPVIANGIAGLATSACSQATLERFLLWQMRNMTVAPFNETAQQVFARISAARDILDGAVQIDQGLVNTDPRYIAVPYSFSNLIPTDVQGLTLDRTPQQLIRILTIGSSTGKGGFFPQGLVGRLNNTYGYDQLANGTAILTSNILRAAQENPALIGNIMAPITGATPADVPDDSVLTQALNGTREDASPATRGLVYTPGVPPNTAARSEVSVPLTPTSSSASI